MRKRILPSILRVLMLGLAALSAAQTTPSADEAAIRAADAQWKKAVAGYDLTRTLAAYADDAIMMEPGAPAYVGKQALREQWARIMNDNYFALSWSVAALEASGDLGFTRGRYDVTYSIENRDLFDQVGKYVVVWKKLGNDWKVAIEIYNPDGPPKPHK